MRAKKKGETKNRDTLLRETDTHSVIDGRAVGCFCRFFFSPPASVSLFFSFTSGFSPLVFSSLEITKSSSFTEQEAGKTIES